MKIRKKILKYIFNDKSAIGLELAQHFKFARKNIGGHWEYLMIGDGPALFKMWVPLSQCSKHNARLLRSLNLRGTPVCEDYNVKTRA